MGDLTYVFLNKFFVTNVKEQSKLYVRLQHVASHFARPLDDFNEKGTTANCSTNLT